MKNKSVTYILAFLVLVIWGTIFYKIFFQTEDSSENYAVSSPSRGPAKETETDTFTIAMNYPDPFLKGRTSYGRRPSMASSQRAVSAKPSRSPVAPPAKKAVSWPSITFSGVIRKNAEAIAIVNVGGNTQLVKNGDIINEVKLCSVTEDSIIVSYQKENKIIKKQ